MSFRQYRPIVEKEHLVAFGDCAAGGKDYNACVFLSKTKLDVPLVYHSRGVGSTMTTAVYPVLEKIFDVTSMRPTVCYERAEGGASEMDRLFGLNRLQKYIVYKEMRFGTSDPANAQGEKLGWSTNTATRPQMLGDLKNAIDNKLLTVYDKPTIEEMFSFIIKNGKPQAEEGMHDDLVMALAGAWQLHQIVQTPLTKDQEFQAMRELPVEPWRKRDFY